MLGFPTCLLPVILSHTPSTMPTRTIRHHLIAELEQLVRLLAQEERVGHELDTSASRDLAEIVEIRTGILATRYLNSRIYETVKHGMVDMLQSYDDRGFKAEVRMDKLSFYQIVRMIEGFPIFQNRSRNQQAPVWVQCFVAFRRLGTYGNANSLIRNAHHAGFAEGSVVNFTNRVVAALLSLHDRYIHWPDADERSSIKSRFRSKFGINGAVGIVDGTPIVFSQKPSIDGETFFSRKGFYCINLQLICDDTGMIRHYLTGWPGSVFDNTLFEKMAPCRKPGEFFNPGEFLLADSGYSLRSFCLVPYRQPFAAIPHNQLFNELFSSARVKIEHVNGVLKGRWAILKGIPTQVKTTKDFKRVNEHVVVCLILHNILHQLHDEWENDNEESDESDNEEDERIIAAASSETDEGAKQLRILVQNSCLNWFYSNK